MSEIISGNPHLYNKIFVPFQIECELALISQNEIRTKKFSLKAPYIRPVSVPLISKV